MSPVDQNYSLPGFGNTPINYTLKWSNLGDVLTTPEPLRYIADSACPPGTGNFSPKLFTSDVSSRTCIGNAGVVFNPVVLHQLVLPNGRTYTFTYDIFGAINKVVLPTGGYERYEYEYAPPFSSPQTFSFAYAQANRGVSKQFVSHTGLSGDEIQWQYSSASNYVNVIAPDGTRTERFMWTDGGSSWGYSADSSRAGRAFDERVYSVSGQMIRRKLTEWTITGSNASGNPSGTESANRNARITRLVEILLDTGGGPALAKTTTIGYDTSYQFDVGIEQTAVNEFDFVELDHLTAQTIPIGSLGSIPNGTPLRTTETDYLTNDVNYRSRNLLGLPTARRIKNGSDVVVSQTVNTYDEAAYPLLTYPSVTNWTNPNTNFRGNITSVTRWLNFNGSTLSTFPQGTYVSKHNQYDQCGSLRKTWDARDTSLTNPLQLEYADTFHRAYLTNMTTPDPDGAGPLVALASSTAYDFSTGLVTAVTDPNSQTTTFDYTDPLNRLKQIIRAVNDSSTKNQTTYTYDDVGRTVTTTSDLNTYNDNILKIVSIHDGFGRLQEMQRHEGGDSYISVQQQYDAFGRGFKTSNPFRPGDPLLWTTSAFDGLGRVLAVTSPDNAMVSRSYVGNAVTTTDQAGKQRKSISNSIGQLKQVIEAPNDPAFQYLTTYEYDTVGNLTHVTQDSQHRYFMYDSLMRLIRSRNPEQGTYTGLNLTDPLTLNGVWSSGYQYDANGNVTQKTDPRGVVATHGYDALNRDINVSYSNDPSGTLPVTFVYDSAVNGKGRFHKRQATGASGSLVTMDSYDAMGRPKTQRQQFFVNGDWSQSYTVHRTYNRAGNVISQTYPSERVVNYGFDNAGRLTSGAGNLGDGTTRTYSEQILYSPFGGISKEKFGTNTPIYNKLFYNNRGQLAEIRESTSYTDPTDTSADRGAIVNHFSNQCEGMCAPSSSMTDNNGNLRKQDIVIPGHPTRRQEFDYDPLNRLNWAREVLSGVEQWKQQFTYDRWGNRTINTGVSYGGVNEKDYTINPANNRLGVPGGQAGVMDYDSSGNLINDTYTGAGNRTYDAENRIVSAWGGNNQAQLYGYDSVGQRIKRTVNGVETWQIYGFTGELLAEYPANGAVANPQKEYGYRNGQLLISADAGIALAPPPFADDFNDNSLNTSFWTTYSPGTPTVSEQGQQLQVALSPNTAGYNGVYSNSTYDLTSRMVQVESVQAVSQAGWCENLLQLELNANNYFMIQVGAGSMIFRARVNGVNDQTVIPFDGVANRFWRIRHDQSANLVHFETSSTGSVWLTRKTVTPGFSLTALRFHLAAGAYGTGNNSPGTAKYDNLKLLSSTTGSFSLTVPNGGFEAPVIGNGNFQYAPSGGSWSFANGGGISGMNSGFTGVPSVASEGVQVAFLQATGEVSQSISGFQASADYVITFSAIQRTNCCNTGGQDIGVYIDTTQIGSVHPGSSGYTEYSFPFTTTSGAHTIKFVGLNPLGGDHTAFIDDLRITGSPKPGYGIQWLVTDHLGTPRMILDEIGSLANVKRHDYLPFGEELFAPTGGRSTAQGYGGGDGVRQQFTAQQRDFETGLDYFNARYYSSTQGRFTSPDPFGGSGFVSVPQSWNKYAYVLNRPFVFTDPTGEIWLTKDDKTYIWVEDADYYKNADTKYKGYSIANGAIIQYRGSTNCDKCKNIPLGHYVQLGENKEVVPIDDDTVNIFAEYNKDELTTTVPAIVGGIRDGSDLNGPPGGMREIRYTNGDRTERFFDENGRPWVDVDYGHEHNPDTHVHWWEGDKRGPAEPLPAGWWRGVWDSGEPTVDPNQRRQNPTPGTIPILPADMPAGMPVRPGVPVRPMVPLRPVLIP